MMEPTVGLNPDQVQNLANRLSAAGAALSTSEHAIRSAAMQAWWSGPAAEKFRAAWAITLSVQVRNASHMLNQQAAVARNQRQQQIETSSHGINIAAVAIQEFPSSNSAHTYLAGTNARDQVADLVVKMKADQPGGIQPGNIRIIKLDGDPPRLIIVMPGVEDFATFATDVGRGAAIGGLTRNLAGGAIAAGVAHQLSGSGEKRTLTNATAGNMGGYDSDPYAKAVHAKLAEFMRENGLPPGTEAAIIGHSYGSMASKNLIEANDGLIKVTHWVPTAAGQDIHNPKLPADLNVLSVNNSGDIVPYAGLIGNVSETVRNKFAGIVTGQSTPPVTPTGIRGVINVNGALGDHKEPSYGAYIANSPNGQQFFDSFGSTYGGTGTSFDIKVDD
jgi:hypothetical protein